MLKRGIAVIGIIWGVIALLIGFIYLIDNLPTTAQFILLLLVVSIFAGIFLYPMVDEYFTDREEIKQYLNKTDEETEDDDK